jgi:AAA family ATP:ADP antiporter
LLLADKPLRVERIVGLSILAFMIMLSYSLSRPTIESLFLDAHSNRQLPIVWLLVAFGVIGTVSIYNRYVVSCNLLRMLSVCSLISAVLLVVILILRILNLPLVHYLMYAWKDIYVVVLVELFYSYANTIYSISKARWLYGLYGAIGAVGGIIGNLGVEFFAEQVGTVTLVWMVPIVLVIIGIACFLFAYWIGNGAVTEDLESRDDRPASFVGAVKLVNKSSYLLLLVGLIVLAQVVINLVDFEYNTIVYNSYDGDARTAVMGMVYRWVDIGTITLNLLAGPLLRLVGVPIILVSIPVLLGAGLTVYMMIPQFATMAVVKVASKCFDYTLFRVGKEMLYIPLKYDEITQGKAVVDILTYRIAKGGVSVLLWGLVALQVTWLAKPMSIFFVALWIWITTVVIYRFRQKVSRQSEMLKI